MKFIEKVQANHKVVSEESDLQRFFKGQKPEVEDGAAESHHNEKGLNLSQAIDSFMYHLNEKAPAKVFDATLTYAANQKIEEDAMKEYARKVWKYAVMLRRKFDKIAVSEEGEV